MDHLAAAKELLDNFWNREPATNAYGEIDVESDAIARQAEVLPIIAHALVAIAENGRKA